MKFSVLAALSWAIVNTLDKYVLTKWINKPVIPMMVSSIIAITVAFLIFIFKGFSTLSISQIILALLGGLFSAMMSLFYLNALKREEVTRVIPLFYLAPLFIAILAAIFLREVFQPLIYLGVIFLISGAILISNKSIRKISLGKAFWFMIASSLSLSINQIIVKYLLAFTNFWTIFSYVEIGYFLSVIPIFYFNFSDLKKIIQQHGKKVAGVISLSTLFNILGILLITIAISIGAVTLVNALSSIQPFFVLLFAVLLNQFYPNILKEEVNKSTILIKFFAILLMFIGVILIT
ncbi:DMT family transporter [Candidatus Woesearchaeota archaeon]|nr:DMT family transporter [Candidatus Woesearchaeota archaeon]